MGNRLLRLSYLDDLLFSSIHCDFHRCFISREGGSRSVKKLVIPVGKFESIKTLIRYHLTALF